MLRSVLIALGLLLLAVVSAQSEESSRAWSVRLSAQVGSYRDTDNLFGQSKVSRAFLDPPVAPDNSPRVRLFFSHGGSVDMRALSQPRNRWEFTVETDVEDAEVILRWENLASVPRRVQLWLVDQETGRRLWMRTAPAYTFRSGKGITRRQFAVEMDDSTYLPLRITQLRALPTRGGGFSLQFNLNKPANVRVHVLSAKGERVREVEPNTSRQAGLHTLQWDGRDSAGTALPAGAYLIELLAVTENMEQTRAVIPVVLSR